MFVPVEGVPMSKGIALLKIIPGMVGKCTVQSVLPELVVTHWFGRQFICPGPDCPACETYAARLSVWNLVTVEIAGKVTPRLLELSQQSWARLRFMMQFEADDTVRGAVVVLRRGTMRSAVVCEPAGETGVTRAELAGCEPLLDSLAVLFKLPPRRVDEVARVWLERIRPFCLAQLEKGIVGRG